MKCNSPNANGKPCELTKGHIDKHGCIIWHQYSMFGAATTLYHTGSIWTTWDNVKMQKLTTAGT